MHIIGKEQTLLQLFPPGADLGSLTVGVTKAVEKSFVRQTMRNPTRDEISRRFTLCVKWAKVFRGDLKWGIQRIVDEFDNVLRADALGIPYEPPTRQCWIPSDGV